VSPNRFFRPSVITAGTTTEGRSDIAGRHPGFRRFTSASRGTVLAYGRVVGDGERGFLGQATQRLGALTVGFFGLVVLASGGTGLTLLIWPGSTERFFSWALDPEAAAALIGGLYVASSALFAWSLTRSWAEARSLCVGVYGLTVPTLLSTIVHDELFDAGRWQAWAWWILFVSAPPAITVVLVANRHRPVGQLHPLLGWVRGVLGLVGVLLGGLALAILFEPVRSDIAASGPVELVGLTGAYLGAWCAFVAAQVLWAAWRGTQEEAVVPAAALALTTTGALVAALRTFSQLTDAGAIATYLVLLVVGIVVGVVLTRTVLRPETPDATVG
jgi:hypothetical protein